MEKGKIRELTKAELQVMQLLWSMERAYVNDLLDAMDEPKPAYNTISTIVRILERKGFVSHKTYGKTHQYYPVVARDVYVNSMMKGIMNSFFSGSLSNLVSFFTKREQISLEEADKLLEIIENSKK